MLFLYVTLITCSILPTCYSQDWIDPYKMTHTSDRSQSSMKLPKAGAPELLDQNSCTDTVCISYYKRLVNMLLKSASRKTVDDLAYEGKLFIQIPIENYNILKEFASSKGDVAKLQSVDEILSNFLLVSDSPNIADALLSWGDYIHIRFYNTNTLICLSCIFVLLLSYKLLRANLTLGSVFKYLIFLGWVVDFSFRWITLLQEAEIKNMVALKKFNSIPANCDPRSATVWRYIASFFSSSDDCIEYHHVLYKDQFYSISPLVVFSHQVGIVFHTPASYVGQALGSFTSGILQHLPWGINIVLLPLLLVFAAIIICIGLTFLTETSFGVSILGIFKFNFGNGNSHRGASRDAISGDNLSALLNNFTSRNLIEDVKPTTSTSNRTNSEEFNCSKKNCFKKKLKTKKIETNRVENLTCIEPQTKDEIKIADETNENVIHDGGGDSK